MILMTVHCRPFKGNVCENLPIFCFFSQNFHFYFTSSKIWLFNSSLSWVKFCLFQQKLAYPTVRAKFPPKPEKQRKNIFWVDGSIPSPVSCGLFGQPPPEISSTLSSEIKYKIETKKKLKRYVAQPGNIKIIVTVSSLDYQLDKSRYQK